MGLIRATPRRYAWTEFRSTLEADWAATLDGLGIRWEYEPETITLPSGQVYVPDFRLPDIGTWIEVKGDGVPRIEKAEEFARTLACTCPPPPAPCTCQWEGGWIVLIGRAAYRPVGGGLRFGGMMWSSPTGSAFLTSCRMCGRNFWIQPRHSWRCRHCRKWRPGNVHLNHLSSQGEMEFRRADRIRDPQEVR